ncbi:uncharacterized protein IL334_003404 [Kwoniella shivajii]|uniref:Methylglutaconyl-CoA hydratase n=1 Tax=Kwoniella shivajii TaxID=564305 RepID=A0ABZ1CXG0_9TREE|nr:hypothetical protein IL334_003404 [Kwoniella shivajii]
MSISVPRYTRTLLVRRTHGVSQAKRYISASSSEPHAYLRPLLQSKQDAEGDQGQLESVMCLVLNRPNTKNALSVRMVGEMREALAKLNSMCLTSARILLLHSSQPGIFCSGADLRERGTMTQGQVSNFLDSLRDLLKELEGIRIPSIGVIDGYALGGGAELALGCDLRVGGENTKIALPETKLGIIPGAGGTQRLTHLIGISKAKEMIYTGRHIDGIEAERIGLLNRYSPTTSSPLKEALLLSCQILSSAPLALSAAKSAISSAGRLSLEDGLDLERNVYNALLDTEDRQEGLMAFKEKRRAVFKGK